MDTLNANVRFVCFPVACFFWVVFLFHVIFMGSPYFWRFVNAVLNRAGYCSLHHTVDAILY